MSASAPGTLRRGLGVVPLAAIVFFNVSGGPYGIEDTVPAFGPGLTLLLLLVTPLVWSLPVALVMSELAAAMPDEGGYVTWVRQAFGPFWSFQVGWWSWIDSFVDVAVYPALFVEYLKFWRPELDALERWLLALAFIAVLTGLNLAGVNVTGGAAVGLGLLALVPIVLFVAVGMFGARVAPWSPAAANPDSLIANAGVGLSVAMWNYSGWDTPSTCLGETRGPERTYRRAMWMALPVITAAYVLPVAAGLAVGSVHWSQWDTGTLPRLAEAAGGAWLGHVVAFGAVVGAAGQFLSLLLTNSRIPYVLARDGLMPRPLGVLHPRFRTPWAAIMISAVFYSALAAFPFKDLVVLTIWLYSLGLIVELAAFVWLRITEPSLPRPWRVPGGVAGAILITLPPGAMGMAAMLTAGWFNALAGTVGALSGLIAYHALARRS